MFFFAQKNEMFFFEIIKRRFLCIYYGNIFPELDSAAILPDDGRLTHLDGCSLWSQPELRFFPNLSLNTFPSKKAEKTEQYVDEVKERKRTKRRGKMKE